MICAKKQSQEGSGRVCVCVCAATSLDSVAKEGLVEKVTFEKRVRRDEWVMEIPRKEHSRQGNSKGEGHELVYLRNRRPLWLHRCGQRASRGHWEASGFHSE